jgi:protein O-GlcNAc transferase
MWLRAEAIHPEHKRTIDAIDLKYRGRPLPLAITHSETFQRALAAFQKGNTKEAERLFKTVLRTQPNHIGALNLLGVLLTQSGRFAGAETYLRSALQGQPNSDTTLYNYGIVLKALNRPTEALERFTEALAINPTVAEAWNNRGTVLNDLKRHDEAVSDFDRAIEINPHYAEALCNKGKTLTVLKRAGAALFAFERALALKPDLAEAWQGRGNLFYEMKRYDLALTCYEKSLSAKPELLQAQLGCGNAFYELKRYDEALASYKKALSLKSDLIDAWLGQGNVCFELKRYDDALTAYDKALSLDPNCALAHSNRATVFLSLKRYAEALGSSEQAISLDPGLGRAHSNRGAALSNLKRYAEALASCDRAILLDAGLAAAHSNRGSALVGLQRYSDALASYDQALAVEPGLAEASLARGNALLLLKRYVDAVAAFDRAISLKPDLDYALSLRLHGKQYMCDWTNFEADTAQLLLTVKEGKLVNDPFVMLSIPSSAADQLQCAKHYVQNQSGFRPVWQGEVYSHDRIRVAYLSADFREHPVSHLTIGLFEQHDRSRFEVTGISFGPDENSPIRQRLKDAFEHFVDVAHCSDQEIADLVRRLEIDIVVDLMGFTLDNRLNVLAQRAAPIQVNYLGYSGTLGASYIDYMIADQTVIPREHLPFYTEKIVWLPDCFISNDASRRIMERTPTRSECGLPDTGFVFCCFNNSYKIAPEIFHVWMRLLKVTNNSILWLSGANPTAQTNLRSEAAACGVLPERLIFAPRVPDVADHLARLRQADLFLDTLPYNAHATASDALWVGLPVLTCIGSTFAGRVAASLLKATGLDELITHSLDEYEALALKLSSDSSYLTSIKQKLAYNRDTHPLFDTARFARHIEAAFVSTYETQRAGGSPTSFSVECS